MTTTIPSAQLDAITRLELAADALAKALRAVQHPDLNYAGGAIIAPSGIKHLNEIRTTMQAVERAIRPSDPTAYESAPAGEFDPVPSLDDVYLTELERQVVESVKLSLATDLVNALSSARAQLAGLPEFPTDPDSTGYVLNAALVESSRLGRRIYQLLTTTAPTAEVV